MSMHELGKPGMHIDRTINVGQILTMVVIVTGIIAAYYSIHYDVQLLRTVHEDRISRLELSSIEQGKTNKQMLEALNSIRTDIAIMRVEISRDNNETQSSRNRR